MNDFVSNTLELAKQLVTQRGMPLTQATLASAYEALVSNPEVAASLSQLQGARQSFTDATGALNRAGAYADETTATNNRILAMLSQIPGMDSRAVQQPNQVDYDTSTAPTQAPVSQSPTSQSPVAQQPVTSQPPPPANGPPSSRSSGVVPPAASIDSTTPPGPVSSAEGRTGMPPTSQDDIINAVLGGAIPSAYLHHGWRGPTGDQIAAALPETSKAIAPYEAPIREGTVERILGLENMQPMRGPDQASSRQGPTAIGGVPKGTGFTTQGEPTSSSGVTSQAGRTAPAEIGTPTEPSIAEKHGVPAEKKKRTTKSKSPDDIAQASVDATKASEPTKRMQQRDTKGIESRVGNKMAEAAIDISKITVKLEGGGKGRGKKAQLVVRFNDKVVGSYPDEDALIRSIEAGSLSDTIKKASTIPTEGLDKVKNMAKAARGLKNVRK